MEINNGGGGGGSSSPLTVTDGITPVVNVTTIDFTSGATVTNGGGGTANVAVTGTGGATFIDNEIVSGSTTTFTLANTPVVGSVQVYGNGQRLTPGASNDYTISGKVITTANSFSTGKILADYRM